MKEQHNQEQELYQLEDELKDAFSSYVVKAPSSQDTKALLASLQPAFNEIGNEPVEEINFNSIEPPSLISQLKAQVSFYQWHFWIASMLIFIMLTLLASNQPFSDAKIYFQFAVPLSILLGIFYTYQTWNKQMRTIESITPFPPALLLLSRMIVIFAMNILFGIVGSVYISLTTELAFNLLSFLLYWIAPSMFIYGVIAYMMMRKGVKYGIGLGIATWIGFILSGPIYQIIFGYVGVSYSQVLFAQGTLITLGLLLLFLSYKKSLNIQTV
ncbi:hypothetical protein [Sutcliffiella rhizosphaerae]|uniref:Uncharacterized protein n=1 Tax=Sutcliffiella rhizosphaerae TaxID=2880967 RepID=A0ABN8AE00_9BACI|nr:hypothetical protein [Sutcliffiella rhizosphaerae]CAG9621010.1 hypothetical protein BACCIP111883_01782 [Sutcliffiella rhizosphaerae]